jgi:uncharacterized protein (TIGR02001 family)
MKKFTLASLAVASLLTVGAAAPAAAQTPEASPLTFNATVTSEYRYRGISQSRFKPAVQLGADYAFPNGFYVGTWASTIKWIKDGGGKADFELDVYGGYKGEIAEGVAYDVGVLQYVYPGHKLAVSPNTTELYGAVTVGPFTAKYSHSTTNLFGFAGSKNSGYLDVTGSFDLGDGLMLTPHVGHQKVEGAGNGIYSYTDYALTLSKDFNGIVPSLSILGTDAPRGSYVAPNGKQLGRSGVVVSVKYNF